MRSLYVAILTMVPICLSSSVIAQAPDSLSFQGYITNPGGVPINNAGGASMIFTLYEGSSDIWSEVQPNVPIQDGIFNVLLGSVSPLDTVRFGRPLLLGIKVGADPEISPRTPLGAAAYAKALPGFYTYRWVNATGDSYNVVGGSPDNLVDRYATGATISGGGASEYFPNAVDGDFGTVGGGLGNTSGHASTVGGGLSNTANGKYAAVGGGSNNTASGENASVGAGAGNVASNTRTTVGGGRQNTASGHASTVGGGHGNMASGIVSTVGGGYKNVASGDTSSVSGGALNTSIGAKSTVGGGRGNTAGGSHATVGGGRSNTASGQRATVSGGRENTASGHSATVGGGTGSTASGDSSTVAGGTHNTASGLASAVGGGAANRSIGGNATVAGGLSNTAMGVRSAIGGGRGNAAIGQGTTVAGGQDNVAGASEGATIGGGTYNTAIASNATVGGGETNTASGTSATVPGGFQNQARGDYSFAAGRKARAAHDGSFVWSDGTIGSSGIDSLVTSGANQFRAKATGGVWFYSNADTTTSVYLAPGSGAWAAESDRNSKTGFDATDPADVLKRLSTVPIQTWRYKGQDESITHMGPMAQDFYAAFGLGIDDKHIVTVDADGVALAAIQGLYELVQEQQALLAGQQTEIERMRAVMARAGLE
jgi:hypothetical protein